MFIQVITKESLTEASPDSVCYLERNCSLDILSNDIRRMLTIQFKEFIHTIEDFENNEAKQQYHCCLDMR